MIECTHKTVRDYYVKPKIDQWGDRVDGYWEYGVEEYLFEDIDVKRYRCTRCKQIFSY